MARYVINVDVDEAAESSYDADTLSDAKLAAKREVRARIMEARYSVTAEVWDDSSPPRSVAFYRYEADEEVG